MLVPTNEIKAKIKKNMENCGLSQRFSKINNQELR